MPDLNSIYEKLGNIEARFDSLEEKLNPVIAKVEKHEGLVNKAIGAWIILGGAGVFVIDRVKDLLFGGQH